MPATRLSLINDCLLLTGENTFSAPDDGSPEWLVCSASYDAAVEHLLDEHDWNFAKNIIEIEDRTTPDNLNWEDAYEKPAGALHIVKVMDIEGGKVTDYKITGNQILVNNDEGLLVEYLAEPEPDLWPGLFVKALRHSIMAGIYRGLKKDPVSARAEEKMVEFYLGKARPRSDIEEPGRPRFISTLSKARSRRRG
jgi:hypothetical protein